MTNIFITEKYLNDHPDEIFVFGDNVLRVGKGGAAILRDHPQSYGFITKKKPTNEDNAFYMPMEYVEVYCEEIKKLEEVIKNNKDKTFLISKLGAGLANRFGIWEDVIEHFIKNDLDEYDNVKFLW